MNHPASSTASEVAPPIEGWRSPRRGIAMAAGLAIGALMSQWLDAPWVAAGAVVALIAGILFDGGQAVPKSGDKPDAAPGDRDLAQHVVPVWQRNITAANAHAERSAALLLESFASITDQVDEAVSAHDSSVELVSGSVEALMVEQQPQIDTLTSTAREAIRLKDEMLARVTSMTGELDEMVRLSKQVQNIARATHLLAMNASAEAARSSQQSGGSSAVAEEIRSLAAQSRQAGAGIAAHVMKMQERMAALRAEMRGHETSEPEILLQAEENARAVLSALLHRFSQAMRSAHAMHNASRQVQTDLERFFIGLQSQDRLNQMLGTVTQDMDRFIQWSKGEEDPAADSVRAWLERLEATYPMEELRSSHHDTVVVEQQAAVEFF